MHKLQINTLLIVGFLLAFGGVGGIEASMDTVTLVQATLIAIAGLSLTWCGIQMLTITDYQQAIKHNPTLR